MPRLSWLWLKRLGSTRADERPRKRYKYRFPTSPWPLRKDGERDDLRVREHHRAATLAYGERVICFPPVIHEYLERDELDFQGHAAPTSSAEHYGRRWVKARTLRDRHRQ